VKRKRLRFLLVDDHPVVRAGIKQILIENFDVDFAEAGNAQEALAACGGTDLVVMDVSMPGRSGIDLLTDLKKCCGETAFLVLSMHEEEQFARRALKAGASGYVTKASAATELARAVRKVLEGGTYISEKFGEYLANSITKGMPGRMHETFSDREFEVFRLIAAGRSGKEIAVELSLSFKTVSTYRTRVLQKLNLQTNYDLVNYARREGFAE
jgi:two-component system invasion response regulator UvrY